MEPYLPPVMDLLEIGVRQIICQSQGRSLNYGNENAAGGNINDDNFVDGGEF